MNYNLALPFFEQARAQPDALALHVAGVSYSYGELAAQVSSAASTLRGAKRVAVLASRTPGAYIGLLAACWSGAGYVPLSPRLPEERLAATLAIIRPDALVVDDASQAYLTPALMATAPPLVLNVSQLQTPLPEEEFPVPALCQADDLAYVMFTSGSTGVPKGVPITLGAVAQFLEAMHARVRPVSSDRVSQNSALSFDVSVFEMFMAWGSGASVHVVPANQRMAPARFIIDQRLTIWSSVPSLAAFMRGFKMLKPGAFPSLRYTGFCGEALPYPLAEAWQAAAPNSIVENLYGPTEATVCCIGATAGPTFPPTPGRNTVPSGFPLPGVEVAVVDESLAFLPHGKAGQLAIAGGQLAKGYYNDPEMTRQRFPVIDGKIWYLTGDLTRQDETGAFHHLGRIDRQVKILGQRVELEEIEAHLRAASSSENVAAIAWPIKDGLAQGVHAFTSGISIPSDKLLEALRRKLPSYMVPHKIHSIEAFPLNPSGKIDYKALAVYVANLPPRPLLRPALLNT